MGLRIIELHFIGVQREKRVRTLLPVRTRDRVLKDEK